jgi:predicted nuclease of restriction endonuclease-like RecB superfamily
LLPHALVSSSVDASGAELVPRYLGPGDAPWLRALLELYAAFEGQPRSALAARLREPLSVRAPRASLRVACAVLERATPAPRPGGPPAEAVRRVVFGHAARERDRERVLALASAELGHEPGALEELLFSDLRSAARVGPLPAGTSPASLALDANQALASSLLGRSQAVRIRALGNARALVRHAQVLGLLCSVERASGGYQLDISGPFALFRHTLIYGRRLASLLPRAAWCSRFEL